MGNNTHVTNVSGPVHEATDLILRRKLGHLDEDKVVELRRKILLLTYGEVTIDDQRTSISTTTEQRKF